MGTKKVLSTKRVKKSEDETAVEESRQLTASQLLPAIKPSSEFNFVKKTCPMIKLSEMPVGSEFMGVYLKTKIRQITDKKTAELKDVKELVCCKVDDDEFFFSFLVDAGFMSAFNEADVQPNDVIKIVKLSPKNISEGRRVNQYEIYIAE